MSGSKSEVLVERNENGVAVVRVNRPEAMNALNLEVRRQLGEAFASFHDDENVRAVVLTGSDKVFAAGADLKEFVDTGPIEQMKRRVERYWQAIAETPQPVIAAVNGFALGGGMELAMSADIIIAGEGAQLGQPEVKVGIIPGAGGTQKLTRAVGKYQAMLLCLTGDFISAAEGLRMGVVSKVVPDCEVFETAMKMAERIARLPTLAVQSAKEMVLAGGDASLASALTMERKAMQVLFASADKKEAMTAFIEKRKPVLKGA
ncbi:MAG: enoyl-CoA hydratase/isomerase family protein [Rhodobiaceae bacterium]|nr:enoyl-CoA hydratase/isomerase family protein [Rhodobiaceae bacterium]